MSSTTENTKTENTKNNTSLYFKLYELFIEKLKIKFCPIRLALYGKNPIDVGWTDPDYDPIPISWDRHPGNIGIIPGRSNLLIVDCDTKESIEFFENLARQIGLNLNTLIVKTRRGAHYYYYCPFSEQLEKKQFTNLNRNIKIDLLAGNKCQGVAPFSMLKLDHEGNILKKDAEEFILFTYEPIHVPEILPEITEEQYQALIKELEKTLQKTKEKIQTTATVITTTTLDEERELTDEEIEKIVEILSEYFIEGQRQNVILYGAGYLRKKFNVSIESIYKLYERLQPIDDKKDVKARLAAIKKTFEKDLEDISGKTGLIQILGEEKANELCDKIKQALNVPIKKPTVEKPKKKKIEGEIPHEELNKENSEDFLELLGIQNVKPEENTEENKFIYIEISKKSKKYARCDFKEKIIEYGQFKKDERTEEYFYEAHYTVFDCIIDKIYAIENPLTQEKKYEIHFVSKNPEEAHTALKGTLQEIWEEMKAKTSYVINPSIALNILTATFSYYLKRNWYEKKKESLPPGFYFIDDEIIAQNFEEKPYTKKDLQNAALFLNNYIYSHPNPPLIASIIRAGILLPFSFAQKQAVSQGALRKRMKYLFLTGETKSGKTTTAMLLSKIWGTENKISYASFCTEARAGKHLSTSTHILIVDEVSKDLETSTVKELLKYAQEDLIARSIQSKSLKQIHYPALSALIMTSNSHFPEDPALLERFFVFRFRKIDKISAADRAKYEKEDFNYLWPLSQFIYQYIKKHGLRDNYIIYATEILKAFYEAAEVEAEWLKWAFIHDTAETEEEQEYKREAEFFNAVQRFFLQFVKPQDGMDHKRSVYHALKNNFFGRWIWVDDKNFLYISKDFLLELKKLYRCDIKDLEELSELTGWIKKVKRYKSTTFHVVETSIMDFFYRLNYIPRLVTSYEFNEWIDKRLTINPEPEIDNAIEDDNLNTLNPDLPF